MDLIAALSGLSTAKNLLQSAIDARDFVKLQAAISDLNNRIIDLQNSCMATQQENATLTNSVRNLEEEIRKRKDFQEDLMDYELRHTARGGLVYVNKNVMSTAGNSVYLCANCVNQGKKTYLQPDQKSRGFFLFCNEHGNIPSDIPDRTAENTASLINKLAR